VKGHKPPVAWAARAARFALEIHEIRVAARTEPLDPITD
jgi:hypothetical protein